MSEFILCQIGVTHVTGLSSEARDRELQMARKLEKMCRASGRHNMLHIPSVKVCFTVPVTFIQNHKNDIILEMVLQQVT